MNELPLTMELVTPLFLGGAQARPNEENENTPYEWADLRVPSIRGALRYWLRAALGGAKGDKNITVIHQAESEIFGSTNGASAVLVRANWRNDDPMPKEFKRSDFEGGVSLQIPQIGKKGKASSGRNYLLWSMTGFGESKPRSYFEAGNSIKIILTLRPVSKPNPDALLKAGAALWLLANLGGIGSRSRRCAGSISFSDDHSTSALPDSLRDMLSCLAVNAAEEFAETLGKSISINRRIFGFQSQPDFSHGQTEFDILHPQTCKIFLLHGTPAWKNWKEAMEHIGTYFSNFRYKRPNDDPNVRIWILNGNPAPPTVERAVFGLPLPFRYGQGAEARGDVVIGANHERRASPLHLRITKLKSGEHVGVATLFKAKLLPEREGLKLQRRRSQAVAAPSNFQLIESLFANNPYKDHINIIPVNYE